MINEHYKLPNVLDIFVHFFHHFCIDKHVEQIDDTLILLVHYCFILSTGLIFWMQIKNGTFDSVLTGSF